MKNEKRKIKLEDYITINGFRISFIEWSSSVNRHFIRAEEYIIDIIKSLDNKVLPLFESEGYAPFCKTASATSALISLGKAESDFRDSCFRICPEKETVFFFHLGYIKSERKYLEKVNIINTKDI